MELNLWREDMGGDRRISIDPAQVAYFTAVEKRVTFGGNEQCTKVTLKTGESFVVTACYDAFQRALENELAPKP